MIQFDDIFPDIAEAEGIALQVGTRRSGTTFLVRELYCSRPRCDCWGVMLVAVEATSARQPRIGAMLHYDFAPARRGEPQLALDARIQDSLAHDLAVAIAGELAKGYREVLIAHQALWRAAVDDRRHPAHARLTALLAEAEAPRPARQPRAPRTPRKARATATSGVELELAARTSGANSKVQKRFTSRLREVDDLRARVRAWQDQRPAIDRDLAIYQAEFATQRGLARQLVETLDELLVSGAIPTRARAKVARLIRDVTRELIEDGHHDLKAIHDRHSKRSYDVDAGMTESQTLAMVREMMERLGIDLEGVDLRSTDDVAKIMERELERSAEEDAPSERERTTRKKTRAQLAKETAAAAAQRDASKVLQDVFRKLAVALHPDLERDDAERARKTTLMQEVNLAYEAKDLLRLLELQLQLEKLDGSARDIAEDRLLHYIHILEEQARELASELDELELPWRRQLDVPPPLPIAPKDVLAALHLDTQNLRETTALQREDLAALRDPKQLAAWLKTVPSARGRAPY